MSRDLGALRCDWLGGRVPNQSAARLNWGQILVALSRSFPKSNFGKRSKWFWYFFSWWPERSPSSQQRSTTMMNQWNTTNYQRTLGWILTIPSQLRRLPRYRQPVWLLIAGKSAKKSALRLLRLRLLLNQVNLSLIYVKLTSRNFYINNRAF